MITNNPNNQIKMPLPETPYFLTALAMLFVPGVYIILILSALFMIAVGGGVIYGTIGLMRHHMFNRLMIIPILIAIGAAMGTFAVLKGIISTIWRKPSFEPALLLDFYKEPKLGAFIAGLCSRVGTRLPDAVILHAEPTFFVTKGKLQVLGGVANGRVLAIGLPLLAAFSQNELRAVLAHELAHFSGKDEKFSAVAYPVYAGAITTCMEMERWIYEADSLSQKLPLCVPRYALELYVWLFHILDMKISRTREIRADIIAANICGSKSFANGLMKIAGLAGAFMHTATNDLINKMHNSNPPANYHIAFRQALPHLNGVADTQLRMAYVKSASKYDSHPNIPTRLKSLGNVPEKYQDHIVASALLTNFEEYEKTLGEYYMALLAMNAS